MASERPFPKCSSGLGNPKMPVEIEKKYRLTAERMIAIADELIQFNAEFCGEAIEENTLFSNSELLEKGGALRLRTTESRSTITFKQRQASDSDAKHHLEIESDIGDPEAVRVIFEKVGLRPIIIYEKRRKTYRLRNIEVVLDELPFGLFMEIEGPLTAIAEAELLLGIDDLQIEYETYPRMTVRLGVKNGDIVEARFR